MKRATTSPTFTAEQIKAAIGAAPEHVHDQDSPYDRDNPKAVSDYFKDAVVTHGGGYQMVRAVINIRLSPEALSAFRATGNGWQTRVDGALRDWLKGHEPETVKVRRGGRET